LSSEGPKHVQSFQFGSLPITFEWNEIKLGLQNVTVLTSWLHMRPKSANRIETNYTTLINKMQ
ncbi:hypothetical protein BpHYR1_008561, partial [Brachionus plicatilis]